MNFRANNKGSLEIAAGLLILVGIFIVGLLVTSSVQRVVLRQNATETATIVRSEKSAAETNSEHTPRLANAADTETTTPPEERLSGGVIPFQSALILRSFADSGLVSISPPIDSRPLSGGIIPFSTAISSAIGQ
ncbi:MAG: hypothetical protein HYS59_02090 [Candidatus Vogelbacteria bacterium]|nr:hypothetical protein [Candidatus Vogelbacteria bacterium]